MLKCGKMFTISQNIDSIENLEDLFIVKKYTKFKKSKKKFENAKNVKFQKSCIKWENIKYSANIGKFEKCWNVSL